MTSETPVVLRPDAVGPLQFFRQAVRQLMYPAAACRRSSIALASGPRQPWPHHWHHRPIGLSACGNRTGARAPCLRITYGPTGRSSRTRFVGSCKNRSARAGRLNSGVGPHGACIRSGVGFSTCASSGQAPCTSVVRSYLIPDRAWRKPRADGHVRRT